MLQVDDLKMLTADDLGSWMGDFPHPDLTGSDLDLETRLEIII